MPIRRTRLPEMYHCIVISDLLGVVVQCVYSDAILSVPPIFITMECPLCCTMQYSKAWSPSQWSNWSPIANSLVGCKSCRMRPENSLDVLKYAAPLVQQFVIELKKGHTFDWWEDLFGFWMNTLHANYRKELGHYEAIRCFDQTHSPNILIAPIWVQPSILATKLMPCS